MKKKILIFILLYISISKANVIPVGIFYVYSEDQGQNWSNLIPLHTAVISSYFRISYVADSPKVYIPSFLWDSINVWYTYNLNYFQVVNVGTFSGAEPSGGDSIPRLSITSYDMDTVFLVWEDKIDDTTYSIKFSCSFDSCMNWFPQTIIFDSLKNSPQSVIKYYPPFLHIVWRNKNKIYYSKSSDYGLTWSSPYIISKDTISFKRYPVIDAKRNFIAVAWQDFRNGEPGIYYNFSTDTGNSWFEIDIPICEDSQGCFCPDIEIDSPYVYTSWTLDLTKMGFAKSIDSGITWIKSFLDLYFSPTMFISITSKGETIYATSSGTFIFPSISQFFYSFNAGDEWFEGPPPPENGGCMEICIDKSNILHLCAHLPVNIKEKYYKTLILNKRAFLNLKSLKNYQIFDISGAKLRKGINSKGIKFIKENKGYIKIIIF